MLRLITPLTQVDDSATFTLGSRVINKSGNEYIYLSGVASTVAYDWVTFTGISSGSVARLDTSSKGCVGIAQGAITNNKYGWFLVAGEGKGNIGVTCTAGSVLYSSGTAGQSGGSLVQDNLVAGAFAKTANAGGSATVCIHYPFMTNTLE